MANTKYNCWVEVYKIQIGRIHVGFRARLSIRRIPRSANFSNLSWNVGLQILGNQIVASVFTNNQQISKYQQPKASPSISKYKQAMFQVHKRFSVTLRVTQPGLLPVTTAGCRPLNNGSHSFRGISPGIWLVLLNQSLRVVTSRVRICPTRHNLS